MSRSRFVAAKLLISMCVACSGVFAGSLLPTCGTDTLYDYINNTIFPGGGCAIGVLDYYDFAYHAISNAPADTVIQISQSTQGIGFNFSQVGGQPFIANKGEIVQFEIDYTTIIDPAPLIPSGKLSIDPTGDVSVTEYYCNDVAYAYPGTCIGNTTPPTLTVGTLPPLKLSGTIVFANPAAVSQSVGILFTLNGTNGQSSFDGADSTSTLLYLGAPEPASAVGLLLGLLTLGASYKIRKQRHR